MKSSRNSEWIVYVSFSRFSVWLTCQEKKIISMSCAIAMSNLFHIIEFIAITKIDLCTSNKVTKNKRKRFSQNHSETRTIWIVHTQMHACISITRSTLVEIAYVRLEHWPKNKQSDQQLCMKNSSKIITLSFDFTLVFFFIFDCTNCATYLPHDWFVLQKCCQIYCFCVYASQNRIKTMCVTIYV